MCAHYSEQQVNLCAHCIIDFAHTHLIYISWEPMRYLKKTLKYLDA